MHNRFDQFAKNILRDALSRAAAADTEVEVVAATQKIDVYSVPDPARAAERAEMGLLGELSAEPSLFEPFHTTPGIRTVRGCLRKQLTWHHELERRARTAAGSFVADADSHAKGQPTVPFPALVIVGPGRPDTVLRAFGCHEARPGVHHAVAGLVMRMIALAELPRTRDTLLLRLLGSGRLLADALADLAALDGDAWEKSVATPLLIHFRLASDGQADNAEAKVNAEIREWWERYQQNEQNLRTEARQEGRQQGRKEGERTLLLRQIRARFGELPATMVARVEAAEEDELERWAERVLGARSLAEVLDETLPQ